MVQAIMDITVNQGIDPSKAVLVGGGGAAGLNATLIGRRLGVGRIIIPDVGAALSAAGALLSDLTTEYRVTHYATSARFDTAAVNRVLGDLEARCLTFVAGPGAGAQPSLIRLFAEARYPDQVWEIEVPLRGSRFDGSSNVDELVADFHRIHQELFAVTDPGSGIEVVSWFAQVSCRLRHDGLPRLPGDNDTVRLAPRRRAYFDERGFVDARVLRFEAMKVGRRIAGPAIVESSFTTVVIDPHAVCERRSSGSLIIEPRTSNA
jgi:N-methylhydantoinase A